MIPFHTLSGGFVMLTKTTFPLAPECTALANSFTSILSPWTWRDVPSINSISGKIAKSWVVISPIASADGCSSPYRTIFGRSEPIVVPRFPWSRRPRSCERQNWHSGAVPFKSRDSRDLSNAHTVRQRSHLIDCKSPCNCTTSQPPSATPPGNELALDRGISIDFLAKRLRFPVPRFRSAHNPTRVSSPSIFCV